MSIEEGLGDLFDGNAFPTPKIGDGLGDFEQTKVGSCRKLVTLDRMSEQGLGRVFHPEQFSDAIARKFGIAGRAQRFVSCRLPVARRLDALADHFAVFTRGQVGQFLGRDLWNLDEEVDAVEERSAESFSVFGDLNGRTETSMVALV